MAARTDRKAARARLLALMQSEVDRLIPEDESISLEGQFFADFEDQADAMDRKIGPAFLAERAALMESAQVSDGGVCPHCGAMNTYLEKRRSEVDLVTPHGPTPMTLQHARCRSCNRTFSPSGA